MSYSMSRRKRRTRWLSNRRVRWRFLGSVLLVAAALGGGIGFAHWIQAPKNAAFLLRRAESLEAEHEYAESARYLRLYLRMVPDDEKANRQLALVLANVGTVDTDFDAQTRLAQALRQHPDDEATLAALLRVNLRLGDKAEALRAAEHLRSLPGRDNRLLVLIGQAYERNERLKDALAVFQEAVKADPRDLVAQENYLRLLTKTESTEPTPAAAIEQMLEKNPASSAALLVAYVARRDAKLPGADSTLTEALLKDPDNVEVLLMAAGDLISRNPRRAGELLQHADKLAPGDSRTLLLLGRWLAAQGRSQEALARFEAGYKAAGEKDPDFAWRTADLFIDIGQVKKVDPYLSLILTYPNYRPVYLFLKGRLDLLAGQPKSAAADFSEALRLLEDAGLLGTFAKDMTEVRYKTLLGLASAELQLGDLDQAFTSAQRAHRLLPEESLPLATMASIHFQSQEYGAAARNWQDAIDHPPTPPQAFLELARSLLYVELEKPRSERKLDGFDRALARAEQKLPNAADLDLLKAEARIASGDLPAAVAGLKAARQGHSDSFAIALSLCRALVLTGDWDAAESNIAATYRQFGSSTELTMTLGILQANRGDLDKAQATLEAAVKRSAEPMRPAIRIALASVLATNGDWKGAEAELSKAAALAEIGQSSLANILLAEEDLDSLLHLVSSWKGAKRKLLWPWADGLLAEGRLRARPYLAVPLLEDRLSILRRVDLQSMETEEIGGLLDEVQKRRQTAIDQSWRAMVRGAADQPLVYRLVRMLLIERRVEDARDVVAWIKHTRFPNPFDARLEAEIDLVDGRQEEALGRAQELAARYRDQRALGQWYADFLTRAGQVERAIEQYRLLCHQFPDAWQPWSQWVKLLSRDTPHSPSLESVLAEIGGKTPHFSRGMCWLAIDERKNAVSELEEAARVEALTACQWRTLLDVLRSDGQPVAEAMLVKARAANPDAFWLPKP